MDELIGRVAAAAGIREDLARQAIGIILKFLDRDGPPDAVAQVLAALPGASQLMAEQGGGGGGGLLGSLAGKLGGSIGGGMGAMAALNELTNTGLDMGEVQAVTRELVQAARERAGDDVVDRLVASIPGLGQVL
ncbi:DUF2267 domain-containing protein [Stappia indica]|jgi:hypothetical protein|uniref:DUF2267 domain-containing protein n=1 Tax=Stappia indica TaxID=538381 RepID=A0A857CE85_9HYPH|nr:DUF2267 domain-containing protein [Stappia indica]QGZ36752.1 DUF2267 domain-containing protein [Stappia indica]